MKTLSSIALLAAFAAFIFGPVTIAIVGPLFFAVGLVCILVCDYRTTPGFIPGRDGKLILLEQDIHRNAPAKLAA